MTREEARQALLEASNAVSTCVLLLKPHRELFERFFREQRDMENFGHIVDPTLYKDSERRAVAAVVAPLFADALKLVKTYDEQVAKSNAALEATTREGAR